MGARRNFHSYSSLLAISVSALIGAEAIIGTQVMAQDLERGQGVRDRSRPEYDAVGFKYRAFQFFPSAIIAGSYNDNIFSVATPEIDDYLLTVAPNLNVQTTWSRHALSADIGGTIERYDEQSDENNTEFYAGTALRLDLTRRTAITLNGLYADLTEERTNNSSSQFNASQLSVEPIEYEQFQAGAELTQVFNRIKFTGSFGFNRFDYDDAPLVGGGLSNQDVRDRDEYSASARLAYTVSPDTNLFIRGDISKWEYDLEPPASPFDRDSEGYEIVTGADFKLGRLAQGEVFVGYQERFFDDDPALNDTNALKYGLGVEWYVSQLTTISINADSSIRPSVVANASSFVSQSSDIIIDHELKRNILLQARIGYTRNKFEEISRVDEFFTAGAQLDYLLNRRIGFFASYDYLDENSDQPILNYNRNLVSVGLNLQF